MLIQILIFFIVFLQSFTLIQSNTNSQSENLIPTNAFCYDKKFYNKALLSKQNIVILIPAYNRPYYLKKAIESLEKNPESKSIPFYFVLDGGPDATQEENYKVIKSSTIKHKEIIFRKRNYGIAKNLIDARRFLFDWCKFDIVIIIEEDMEVSPFYIRLNLVLLEWARKTYSNVGVVQCFSYCLMSKENKQNNLPLVKESGSEFWCYHSYCLNRNVWDDIKYVLYEYEKQFIDLIPISSQYFKERSKPCMSIYAGAIRSWMKDLIKCRPVIIHNRPFTNKFDLYPIFANNKFPPCQDLMNAFALWLAGYIKIQTVVNRAKHIGEFGVTFDSVLFKEFKCDKIELDNYLEDATMTNFKEI